MAETNWYTCCERVEPYIFKILTPRGSGTGFFLGYSGTKKLCGIATAAHVIDQSFYWEEPIRLVHQDSGEAVFLRPEDRIIYVDERRDTASVIFNPKKLGLPADAPALISAGKHLKVGVDIGWMGFPAVSPNNLCLFRGSVSCWLKDDSAYLLDGVVINGVSGGPVFSGYADGSFRIAGVVSAYLPNRATGVSLPGLCLASDVGPFYETLAKLKDFDAAKNEEKKPEQPPATPTPAAKPLDGEPQGFVRS